MASSNSSSNQQLIHSVNAKDKMSMLILEAVKHQRDKCSGKAVSSQEIVAYIESEASNDGVKCDHDEISLILLSMIGEDGPLAQIVESDNSVIKFRLTMDKPWDTEGNSRTHHLFNKRINPLILVVVARTTQSNKKKMSQRKILHVDLQGLFYHGHV